MGIVRIKVEHVSAAPRGPKLQDERREKTLLATKRLRCLLSYSPGLVMGLMNSTDC